MIVTFFFTFLCVKDGQLYQANLCDYEEHKARMASREDIRNLGYYVIELATDKVMGFGKGERFLSAQPDMTLSHAPDLMRHETFRLMRDYQPFRISPVPRTAFIPEVIHQTDSSETPREQFLENIRALKRKNEGYAYKYYNEKDKHDFIYNNFGWDLLKVFLNIDPRYGAARADLFRYLCIYRQGGIYLDMKSGCKRPFREIIRQTDSILLSHWMSKRSTRHHGWGKDHADIAHMPFGEYQQWFLISQAGHPLLEKVINQVVANIGLYDPGLHGTGKPAALRVTGPYPFTRAMEPHLCHSDARMIDSEDEGILYQVIKNYTRIHDYEKQKQPLTLLPL